MFFKDILYCFNRSFIKYVNTKTIMFKNNEINEFRKQ